MHNILAMNVPSTYLSQIHFIKLLQAVKKLPNYYIKIIIINT